MTTSVLTVGEALAAFRRTNGLRDDETAERFWSCRLGPVTIWLPNFAWRRRAILAHDLHHLLTGFPCNMRGEFQMAAWEFAAGPMPHWGATLFCLPLVLAGLLWAPRRILLAFLAGRRARSLHASQITDDLLARPLSLAREDFAVGAKIRGASRDYAGFGFLITRASLVSVPPIALVTAMCIGLLK